MKLIPIIAISALCALTACTKKDDTTTDSQSTTTTQPEKSADLKKAELADVELITEALKKSGFDKAEQKEAEWRTRLATATTNDELQAVMREQMALMDAGAREMEVLSLQTVKGKGIQTKMVSGFKSASAGYQKLTTFDLTDPATEAQAAVIMEDVMKSMADVIAGLEQYIEIGRENNKFNDKEQKALDEKMADVKAEQDEANRLIKSAQ